MSALNMISTFTDEVKFWARCHVRTCEIHISYVIIAFQSEYLVCLKTILNVRMKRIKKHFRAFMCNALVCFEQFKACSGRNCCKHFMFETLKQINGFFTGKMRLCLAFFNQPFASMFILAQPELLHAYINMTSKERADYSRTALQIMKYGRIWYDL